uniref:Diphosphomevalonate decarboxylase n=1 Tax=Sinocyclocheilus grahami TaxID=75366 RepID=A0A672P055_SINGR
MPENDKQSLSMVTCTAPVNIAVIKYWGKRDEDLILPMNSSLSLTLHQDQLKTTTTVACSRNFQQDRIWLNGKEEDISNPRLQSCLQESILWRLNDFDCNGTCTSMTSCSPNDDDDDVKIWFVLVYTLSQLFGVESEQLSAVARQGSGSACRSLYGGFVQWKLGEQLDGKDSLAEQVESESYWPELRVLTLVVSAEQKSVGSTSGMHTSVETSQLLKYRADVVVPSRMEEMIRVIRERDFPAFGELTMKDSNQFHAICLDTYPPIFYLNNMSHRIISLVHRYNQYYGETRVAYTFDAGPNAVIYTLQDHLSEFVQVVRHFFPPEVSGEEFFKGLPVCSADLSEELKKDINMEPTPKGIRYIISTKAGPGPCVVKDPNHHLLGADGLPKKSVISD